MASMDWQSVTNLILPVLTVISTAIVSIHSTKSAKETVKMNNEHNIEFYKIKYANEKFYDSIHNYLRATSILITSFAYNDLEDYSDSFGSIILFADNELINELYELNKLIYTYFHTDSVLNPGENSKTYRDLLQPTIRSLFQTSVRSILDMKPPYNTFSEKQEKK